MQTSKMYPNLLLESVTQRRSETSSLVSKPIPNEVRRLQTGLWLSPAFTKMNILQMRRAHPLIPASVFHFAHIPKLHTHTADPALVSLIRFWRTDSSVWKWFSQSSLSLHPINKVQILHCASKVYLILRNLIDFLLAQSGICFVQVQTIKQGEKLWCHLKTIHWFLSAYTPKM